MGKSNILYISHVWNCVTGCQGKSCAARETCYARELVKRFPAIHGIELGVGGSRSKSEPLYPERIPFSRVVFHHDRLNEPLNRKKPTVYGVGFFGDMFDEQVMRLGQNLGERLFEIFDVMFRARQHQYVLLTKQPQHMAAFCSDWIKPTDPTGHIWFGTTVCTQADAEERIPELMKVPGHKWLSIEPCLSHIDLLKYLHLEASPIGAVILGCESGSKRREMPLEWAQSVVWQCKEAGVPCYVKQLDINGRVSKNPEEWPEELRVRDLPWRKAGA